VSKSTVVRIAPSQKTTTAPWPLPGNYLDLEWIQREDLKEVAYGLRVHSTLAMLAVKGLRAHEADAGIPRDDVYALVDALVSNVDLAAFILAQKLDALPKDVA